MANAKVTLPAELARLLHFQLEISIDQSNLGRTDRIIARRYFLRREPQADIGAAIHYDRSAVSRRLPKITEEIVRTAQIIFPE